MLLQEFLSSRDPDATMLEHLRHIAIDGASASARWRPGRPLKLLLAGYFGAGNVGSDMRASEIVRQIRFLLGADEVEFTAFALSTDWPSDVLRGVAPRLCDSYVPTAVASAVDEHEAVVACEGSMFKSTFSNVLSATMAASLALAAENGKLAVGYGAEVGAMDAALEELVAARVNRALLLCRNSASLERARGLGLRASLGADTAWTFEAAPREAAARVLGELGWNGSDPVLTVCPANPFWWPVRANPIMAFELEMTGEHKDRLHSSIFFHAKSPEIDRSYRAYLSGLARAVDALRRSMDAFPIAIAMERIDEAACRDLSAELPHPVPILIGHRYSVREVVGVLRLSDLLISSRFHALVGAMPAAVPSVGIANDERIRNLLVDVDSEQAERLIAAGEPDLGERVIKAARTLDRDRVRAASRATVRAAVRGVGSMGMAFVDEVRRLLPEFPLPSRGGDWQAHLPPLPEAIERLLG
jgi:polysaccharide pyruvyl transferase WcaK-like protein